MVEELQGAQTFIWTFSIEVIFLSIKKKSVITHRCLKKFCFYVRVTQGDIFR